MASAPLIESTPAPGRPIRRANCATQIRFSPAYFWYQLSMLAVVAGLGGWVVSRVSEGAARRCRNCELFAFILSALSVATRSLPLSSAPHSCPAAHAQVTTPGFLPQHPMFLVLESVVTVAIVLDVAVVIGDEGCTKFWCGASSQDARTTSSLLTAGFNVFQFLVALLSIASLIFMALAPPSKQKELEGMLSLALLMFRYLLAVILVVVGTQRRAQLLGGNVGCPPCCCCRRPASRGASSLEEDDEWDVNI